MLFTPWAIAPRLPAPRGDVFLSCMRVQDPCESGVPFRSTPLSARRRVCAVAQQAQSWVKSSWETQQETHRRGPLD